jgi:hypothetical protein
MLPLHAHQRDEFIVLVVVLSASNSGVVSQETIAPLTFRDLTSRGLQRGPFGLDLPSPTVIGGSDTGSLSSSRSR